MNFRTAFESLTLEDKSQYRIVGSRQCWIIQELVDGEWRDLKDPDGSEHSTFVTKWEAELYLRGLIKL